MLHVIVTKRLNMQVMVIKVQGTQLQYNPHVSSLGVPVQVPATGIH